jgi:hypothetical protein
MLTLGACKGLDGGLGDTDRGSDSDSHSGTGDSGTGDSGTSDEGGQEFISDDPSGDGSGGDYGAEGQHDGQGESEGEGEGEGEEGGNANAGDLDISETDIVVVEGDRLYALSTYSDLTVVDMQDPDDLHALGDWSGNWLANGEADAEPFEMYVENGQALVLFNDLWEPDAGSEVWNFSSRFVSLDTADPQAIQVDGEIMLPGLVAHSRRVGDMLYVVTLQNGDCSECPLEAQTIVTSIDISDPAQPAIADQLTLGSEGPIWDWYRAIASTTERIYITAQVWQWETLTPHIDVIDISAVDGSLVAGAQVELAGNVLSDSQMDEYQGTLRVISQFDHDNPVIETFTIQSSQSIVPLGSSSISIPLAQTLRSAHFDGTRAYVTTSEPDDPVFTIDLSDPAMPQQTSELALPGEVVHVEPRGDRVLALGFDRDHPDGNINISLFDVSMFDQPALRRRVHFGGNWANFLEDEHLIHEAFTIIDAEQMVLVPHIGWDYDAYDTECYGTYHSGVQIIDWLDDDLTLRGLAPARNQALRAFTHQQRIVALSNVDIETFDYGDRDAPTAGGQLDIAVRVDNLVRAENAWVRLARDWNTSQVVLELVGVDDPESPEPLGTIEIGSIDDCEFIKGNGLFVVGNHVFVLQSVETFEHPEGSYELATRVLSIDISVPSAPVLVHTLELPAELWSSSGNIGGVTTQWSSVVQSGNHLVFFMQDQNETVQVVVVDLENPTALAVSGTLDRPDGLVQGQLALMSDTVVSWHTEPVVDQPGKVRFYFDRLDLSGAPSWAEQVNVPGLVVAWDAQTGRAETIGLDISDVDLDEAACFDHPKFWQFDDDSGTCRLIDHALHQLDVQDGSATLLRSIDVDGEFGLEQLFATQSRIFAKLDDLPSSGSDPNFDSRLVVLDLGDAQAEPVELDGQQFGPFWWLRTAVGEIAITRNKERVLNRIDAGDVGQVEIQPASGPTSQQCWNLVFDGDSVYCPAGPDGLDTIW